MRASTQNRRSFVFTFVLWMIGLSMVIGFQPVYAAPNYPIIWENGNESISVELSYPNTMTARSASTLDITVSYSPASTAQPNYVFPKGTQFRITTPSSKGLLFSADIQSNHGFTSAPASSGSQRSMLVTLDNDMTVQGFRFSIAVMPTNTGAFPGGVQTIEAGEISVSITSSASSLDNKSLSNNSSIRINGTSSDGAIASGPGSASASVSSGETISLRIVAPTDPVAMGGQPTISARIWSTKNPFTIPANTTILFSLPSDSPLAFPDEYDGYVDTKNNIKFAFPSGSSQKQLLMTFGKALDVSEYTLTLPIHAAGGDQYLDGSKTFDGGRFSASLKIRDKTLDAFLDTMKVTGGTAQGNPPTSFDLTSGFTPASLTATVVEDALDADTGSTRFDLSLVPIGGFSGISQLVVETRFTLPDGVIIFQIEEETEFGSVAKDIVDIIVGNATTTPGVDFVWARNDYDDGFRLTFTGKIAKDFDFTGFTASIGFDKLMVEYDGFADDPVVATMRTTAKATVNGKEMTISSQTRSLTIYTPEPYAESDDDNFDDESYTPELRMQDITSVLPHHLSSAENMANALVKAVVFIISGQPGRSAATEAHTLIPSLATDAMRPGHVLVDVLRISVAGLSR